MSKWLALLFLQLVSQLRADSEEEKLITEYFTPEELECLQDEKVLYEKTGECYTLLTEGPCGCERPQRIPGIREPVHCQNNSTQWLVLDTEESGMLRAVCRPCPCCDRTLHVFMAVDGKCHHRLKELRRFCPLDGHELRDNEFGEGECACIRAPPHARVVGDSSGKCYPVYHRGPCRQGQVLLPDRDMRTLEPAARCAADPCAHKGEGYAQWKVGDGKCYKLGTQGPCMAQSKFFVQRTTRIPDCDQTSNNIFYPRPYPPQPVGWPKNRGREFGLDILYFYRNRKRAF